MNIIIRKVAGGWVVEDGSTLGPYISRERALDLAEGMVAALRSAGEDVHLVDETNLGIPSAP